MNIFPETTEFAISIVNLWICAVNDKTLKNVININHDSQYPQWPGLEKVRIPQWLVTLLHICGVIPTPQSPISPETQRRYCRKLCADIAGNSARAPMSPHRAPILSHRMASVLVFCDVSQCLKCFMMFHNVLSVSWCFTSGSRCFTTFHVLSHPCGIFLPLTELLQSPFRTEFSMGSRSRRYRRSLRRHRRFLRSYCRSLRRCRDPWGDRRAPMRRRRSLRDSLNIVKHYETHVKHYETL